MKRFCFIFATLFVVLPLQAQSNLCRVKAFKAIHREIVSGEFKTFLDCDSLFRWFEYIGCIDTWQGKGFYLDKDTVKYTEINYYHRYGQRERDIVKSPLKLSEKNRHGLIELLRVASATASPLEPNDIFYPSFNRLNLVYDGDIAECFGKEDGLCFELNEIVKVIFNACKKGDESAIDSLYNRISNLTASFKKQLYYYFRDNGEVMEMCTPCQYISVYANFSNIERKKPSGNDNQYKETMFKIAHYLADNSDGPVSCYINICPSGKFTGYRHKYYYEIVTGIDDFTPERMLDICKKILCSRQEVEDSEIPVYVQQAVP